MTHTIEQLLAMEPRELDILVKKLQGSKVEWCKESPEYGRGQYGENEGYYFFLKSDSSPSNHNPYDTEEAAWDCWGPHDEMELLDLLAKGVNGWEFALFTREVGGYRLCLDYGESFITGAQNFYSKIGEVTPSEAFPRLITIAYIWSSEQTKGEKE